LQSFWELQFLAANAVNAQNVIQAPQQPKTKPSFNNQKSTTPTKSGQ
jgi:hypothetical protein